MWAPRRTTALRIVAYIAIDDTEDLTVSDVRRYLRNRLPDYMIPSFIVTLESLPLTRNGKLDRDALPDVFRSVGDDVPLNEPPAVGTEQHIADIWCEILQVDKVNAEDNFFDLAATLLTGPGSGESCRSRVCPSASCRKF